MKGKALNAKTQSATRNDPVAPNASAKKQLSADALLKLVLESLDDSKAEEISTIDIAGKSSIADHMVVATGRSNRHVSAVADRLLRDLKDAGQGTPKVEGMPACDWVLVDANDVVVHVFRPEVREFYNLEKMWNAIAEGDEA